MLLAALYRHAQVIEPLFDQGAGINTRNQQGDTVLLVVIAKGHEEVIRAVLGRGGDFAASNKDGDTSLHLAYRSGNKKIVEYLISQRANALIKNCWKQTPQ